MGSFRSGYERKSVLQGLYHIYISYLLTKLIKLMNSSEMLLQSYCKSATHKSANFDHYVLQE